MTATVAIRRFLSSKRPGGLAAMVGTALLATACYGAPADVTPAGKGLPQVEVDFPAESRAGSVQHATFTVSNPGPGDMGGITITFARVGNSFPIVDLGSGGENPAVVSVEPEPRTTDRTGVVYRFGPLPEGETAVYEFDLRVPQREGPVANSVTVSAAEDLDRIRGLRLETDLR